MRAIFTALCFVLLTGGVLAQGVSIEGVSLGDTRDTVLKRAVGQKTDISKRSDDVEVIHFVSATTPHVIERSVWLEEGRVVKLDGPRVKVGEKNLESGLGESECRSMLGPPTEVETWPQNDLGARPANKVLYYRYDGVSLMCILVDKECEDSWILDSVVLEVPGLKW